MRLYIQWSFFDPFRPHFRRLLPTDQLIQPLSENEKKISKTSEKDQRLSGKHQRKFSLYGQTERERNQNFAKRMKYNFN